MQKVKLSPNKKLKTLAIEGVLDKLSSNFLIGFQPKVWKLFPEGKIAYRNENEQFYKNTFQLKDVQVFETETDNIFQLKTKKRSFILRANDTINKDSWMHSITQMRKIITRRDTGTKTIQKTTIITDRTLPSMSYLLNNPESSKKNKKNQQIQSISITKKKTKNQTSQSKKDKNISLSKNKLKSINQEKILTDQQANSVKQHQFLNKTKHPKNKKQDKLSSEKSISKSIKLQKNHSKHKQNNKKIQTQTKQIKHNKINQKRNQKNSFQTLHQQLQFLQTLPYSEYFTKLPQHFILYNIFILNLKSKHYQSSIFNIFTSETKIQHKCVLFSSKSLFPQIHTHEDNLMTNMLPSWAQVNTLYKITQKQSKIIPEKMFEIDQIIDITQDSNELLFRVNFGQTIKQYQSLSKNQRDNFKCVLEVAKINALEATIPINKLRNSNTNKKINSKQKVKKKQSKKNYDRLINIHQTNSQLFNQQMQSLIQSKFPKQLMQNQTQLDLLEQSFAQAQIFLIEVIQVLQNKSQPKNHVIDSILDFVYQKLRIMIKLNWDKYANQYKAGHVLKLLTIISHYCQLIKQYRKYEEFIQGMKQLSKIYIRQTWKNFQNIIVNIVQNEKKIQISQSQSQTQNQQTIQSVGITDLFRFIYDVYQISSKPWNHKLHTHNVNKLVQRALQSYVVQIRSTVDQQVITNKKLAAIANGYFRFSQMIDEFYSQKFEKVLKQYTKQSYDKIVRQYRELSMIIVGKIAQNCQGSIRRYFAGVRFASIANLDEIYKIICHEGCQVTKYLHSVFCKKYYDKILQTFKIEVIQCLINNQVPYKKTNKPTNSTPTINRIVSKLNAINKQTLQIFNSFITVDKFTIKNIAQIQQVISILSTPQIDQIPKKISMSIQPWKNLYISLLPIRGDYHQGSKLFISVINLENDNKTLRSHTRSIFRLNKGTTQQMMGSLSKHYMDMQSHNNQKSQYDNSSMLNYNTNQGPNQIKLISQGYLFKSKMNKKFYQRLYFRLKKSTLYIFSDDATEVCLNSIPIDKVRQVSSKPNKETFDIFYNALNREKKIHLKCDTQELRDRWVKSIELEMKRLKNQQKVRKRSISKIYAKTTNKPKQLIIDYEQLNNGPDHFSYH